MIEVNWLHVLLAALAGGGWCLAWGYRTALGIAREQPAEPRPPRERATAPAPAPVHDFTQFGEKRA